MNSTDYFLEWVNSKGEVIKEVFCTRTSRSLRVFELGLNDIKGKEWEVLK